MTDKQRDTARQTILQGNASLGIEFGSTRIKAVLIGGDYQPLATGGCRWENRLEDGVWTYSLDDVWQGMAQAYSALKQEVNLRYGVTLARLKAMGVSGMMHGFLPFDREDRLLTPFRTWRNTSTQAASEQLTQLFHFNIPQRWSIAHLHQAVLNKEPYVDQISFLTTLAGYVHWQLTGEKVAGIGEASGVFPIDSSIGDYDRDMLEKYDTLAASCGFSWRTKALLPKVLAAGHAAGNLSAQGAMLLDIDGDLLPGAPLCAPEGDAGTGMVATNSVAVRTANVSAGTSIFAMTVLEKPLKHLHPEIDMVTTPEGKPAAMIHCNNCTTDLNAWADVFAQFCLAAKLPVDKDVVYNSFFEQALLGDKDGGGVLSYGYHSGEHNTGIETGQPLLLYPAGEGFNFSNFARAILMSALATLALGMRVLAEEGAAIHSILGHGGLYKTGTAGRQLTAAALKAPVSVLATADEGGAWGIALLAAYITDKLAEEDLGGFLMRVVFADMQQTTSQPDEADMAGFAAYLERFEHGLLIEREAVNVLSACAGNG